MVTGPPRPPPSSALSLPPVSLLVIGRSCGPRLPSTVNTHSPRNGFASCAIATTGATSTVARRITNVLRIMACSLCGSMPSIMRSPLRKFLSALALASTAVAVAGGAQTAQPMTGSDPLEVAKVLAARYPAQPIMSYIPALSWSGQLRLATLTGEAQWREKALKDIAAFTSGRTPAIAEPYRLTSLAGALAFFDAATLADDRPAGELAVKVADAMMPDDVDGSVKFATGWTDDMFMAAAVLARTATPARAAAARRLLLTYSS